jgi:2',3'-cyclic-nucleotide 2'-phosphodiesterase (5'-nucleotidase family)
MVVTKFISILFHCLPSARVCKLERLKAFGRLLSKFIGTGHAGALGQQCDAKMTEVIGKYSGELTKPQPDGSLGCFMTDAYLPVASIDLGEPADIAIRNGEGIRISSIAAGNITVGKIFELMPVVNVIMLQKLSVELLNQGIGHMAGVGGWPVNGGTSNLLQ